MMRWYSNISKMTYCSVIAIFALALFVFPQNNQNIKFKYCTANPIDKCFETVEGAIDTVGRDVVNLAGDYRFCLNIEEVDSGYAPLRIVLVLDKSGSMCRHYGPNGCCVDGDGSGLCSKNDPQNKRVEAASAFVNNLAQLSPKSEVGVIVFSSNATTEQMPTSLNTQAGIDNVLAAIKRAECTDTVDGFLEDDDEDEDEVVIEDNESITSVGDLAKTLFRGRSGTNLGNALKLALQVVDTGYASIPDNMTRHIIILTDGGWDDVDENPPETLIQNYKDGTVTSQRLLPTVHGVFLSDSITHVAHEYPANGCSGSGLVELGNLETASSGLTGGLFFGGSTPQTVVESFDAILDSVAESVPQQLLGLEVTNTTNNEVRTDATIENKDPTVEGEVHYEATLESLPLEFGLNSLTFKRFIQNPGKDVPDTVVSTVLIYRTDDWTTEINDEEYSQYCVFDSTAISITVTPPLRFINQPFDVATAIGLKSYFLLDTVNVRIFTEIPDVNDNQTKALFHFEDKLTNSIGNASGTGDIKTSTQDALFGTFGAKSGSFAVPLGTLNGDFAFETWLRPASTTVPTELFSTGEFTLATTADRHLTITIDGNEMATSAFAADVGVWSHVAIARSEGYLYLFINGVPVADPVSLAGDVTGLLTITVPLDGALDEVRISTAHRILPADGGIRYGIAALQNPTWTLGGTQSGEAMLVVPPSPTLWNNGNLAFTFSSPAPGGVIVNMQHRGTTLETQWSKNSNPVVVAFDMQGPYVDSSVFTRGDYGTDYDTLDVYFTEPVSCDSLKKNQNPSASFQIYDSAGIFKSGIFDNALYPEMSCAQTEWITDIRILIEPGLNSIIPKKDSIRMIGLAVDTAGNRPDSTKRGRIEYGPGSGLMLVAIPNRPDEEPMTLNPTDMIRIGIPSDERNSKLLFLRTREVLVPFGEVDGEPNYGEYTAIYDAVGNIVADNVPIRKTNYDDRIYYITWNGMNKHKRRVSTGAYMFTGRVMYANDRTRLIPIQTKLVINWGRKSNF